MNEMNQPRGRLYHTKWNMIHAPKTGEMPGVHHPLIEKILLNRGVRQPDEMKEFLSDKPQLTHDPFQLFGMTEAVQRIKKAIQKSEKIVFYGDYDVDGITSVALLIDFFFPITNKIEFYIPLRQEEGYGLNQEALKEIREDYGADLLITVDCGISAYHEVEYAKGLGLDIIITDHHSPGEQLPEAILINPKQPLCQYPFKELSGCGVAFKLAQALQLELKLPKNQVTDLLDLVAMATVCDVVPLVNENRTLLKYGLKKIRNTKRQGLLSLFYTLSLNQKNISVRDLGFVIGPHFNASGRMDDARLGVQLLVTKNKKTAEIISSRLKALNQQRREIQEEGLKVCQRLIQEQHMDDSFLLVEAEDLHEGVIGIIAGRLRDEFYRPTIVLTPSQERDVYTGSGRSINGFHLFNELQSASGLMEKFGGHANACGLKIKKENVDKLRKYLQERVSLAEEHNPGLLSKEINIVDKVDVTDLDEALVELIMKLEPHGMGNEKPHFLCEHIEIDDQSGVRPLGNEKQHLKVTRFLQRNKAVKNEIEIIGFGVDDYVKKVVHSQFPFHLVFYPQVNVFRGKKSIQLLIKDIKMSEQE